ncbi:MAG: hypothetical protein JXQ96_17475 [Cyclobacteriaceae bacterium]
MRFNITLVLVFVSIISLAQIQTGTVIEEIICKSDESQSYALYLPSNYKAESNWPIVFFFEPAARGRLPLDLYHEIAEELGYILVSSNNSKNGSWNLGFQAAEIMIKDVQERFSINASRVITSGFSGGSRLALALAVLTNEVNAVIGVAAAQPQLKEYQLQKRQDFIYAGLVGCRDMNYQEHIQFSEFMEKLNMPNILIFSAATHSWASANDFKLALLWVDGQFSGHSNEDKIANSLQKKYSKENEAISITRWESMMNDLNTSISAYKSDEKQLSKQQKSERLNNNKELKERKAIFDSLNVAYLLQSGTEKTVRSLKIKIRNLQAKGERSKNPEAKYMYERLVDFSRATAIESAMRYVGMRDYERALLGVKVWDAATSNEIFSNWWYAKIYALMGDEQNSLSHLEKMLNAGFRNKQALESETAFEVIRDDPRYQDLVKSL